MTTRDERERARLLADYCDARLANQRHDKASRDIRHEDLDELIDLARLMSDVEPDRARSFGRCSANREQPAGDGGLHSGRLRRVLWRAATAAAAILLASAAMFGFLRWREVPVSAAELLQRASAAEAHLALAPDVVMHRIAVVEERRPPETAVVSRHRVESWTRRGTSAAIEARRLFDEKDRLVGGVWVDAAGRRTVHSEDRIAWCARRASTVLVERLRCVTPASDYYVLTYVSARRRSRATLTIDRESLAATEETLIVREPDGLREFRAREARRELFAAATVAASVFEPNLETRDVVIPTPAPGPAAFGALPETTGTASPTDLDRLELDLVYRLHRLGLFLEQGGDIRRGTDGSLHVHATVTTVERRALLEQAFETPDDQYGVRLNVDVQTLAPVDELPQPAAVRFAYSLLKDHFAQSATTNDTDSSAIERAARDFATWAVERTTRTVSRAKALKTLATRWPPSKLSSVDLDAAVTWQSMIQDHALAIQHEAELLRVQLDAITKSLPPPTPGVASTARIKSISDVPKAVDRVADLVTGTDRAIRGAFQVCTLEPCPAVDLFDLRRKLLDIEALAAEFATPWSLR
jgi:hypothetical protein